MENKRLSEAQSLELIAAMIRDSRRRLARNAGMPFLVWGYTTVIVSLVQFFVLRYAADPQPWMWGWFAIPVIGYTGTATLCKRDKGARNYVDRVISAVWIVFGITMLAVPLINIVYKISIFFLTVLLLGMGTAITGLVMRDRVTATAGFLGMLAAMTFPLRTWLLIRFAEDVSKDPSVWVSGNVLIFVVICFLLMVIPGHILNRKCNRACSKS